MCSNLPRPKHHAIKPSHNSSNFSHDQLPESIWHLGNLPRSLRLPVDAEPTRYFLALQLFLRPGTWHLALSTWQKSRRNLPSDDPLAHGEISAPVPRRSMGEMKRGTNKRYTKPFKSHRKDSRLVMLLPLNGVPSAPRTRFLDRP